jgi:Zn-dependent protease with chaperone function
LNKIITTILISCVLIGNSFAATYQQAQQVYNRIVQSNGYWRPPVLAYSPSKEFNAYYGGGVITITQGMLDNVHSLNELAFVIGHEFAHWSNWDTVGKASKNKELRADKGGVYIAGKAGYDMCSGVRILLRFVGGDGVHPDGRYRYSLVKC